MEMHLPPYNLAAQLCIILILPKIRSAFFGDRLNTLSFYSGINGTGSLLLSLTGSNLLIQAFGHDLLQINFGNQFFQSIVLTTSSNAFEYTDLQVSSVPIPPALPLFATGLGALGLLGWRRKRKTAARFC